MDSSLLDRKQLLHRCLESKEFTLQMLKVFRDSAPKVVESLKDAARKGLMVDAQRHAHTLKGSAANMAIEPLRQLAAELENLSEHQHQAEVTSKFEALDELFGRSLTAVDEFAATLG